MNNINSPKNKWVVTIPKGGNFQVYYTYELSWWQRFWMKFIGWDVESVQDV